MPFDGTTQAFELFGMGVAAGYTPQFPAFLDEGSLEQDAGELGALNHFGPGNLQEPTIRGWAIAFS